MTPQMIGDMLRTARLRQGLTQKQAGELLGRTQGFVSQIETGYRKITVIEMCELFNLYGYMLELRRVFIPEIKKDEKK